MRNSSKIINILGIILIGLVTTVGTAIYARYAAGDMIMSVDPNSYSLPSISISDQADFEFNSTKLDVEFALEEIGTSYDSIDLNEIIQSQGQFINDNQNYLAYSFYIKNVGTETINVRYYMNIVEVFNWMDEYVRILVIEDDSIYRMYQKPDQPDGENFMPQYQGLPLGIDFVTNKTIFRGSFEEFRAGAVKSFRVIIWLEEQDPDIEKNQRNGSFKTMFVFSIDHNYAAEGIQSGLLSSDNQNLWINLSELCSVNLDIYYEEIDVT